MLETGCRKTNIEHRSKEFKDLGFSGQNRASNIENHTPLAFCLILELFPYPFFFWPYL